MTVGTILVHGGLHSAACWRAMLRNLAAPAVAIDVRDRRRCPADSGAVSLDECVQAYINSAGDDDRLVPELLESSTGDPSGYADGIPISYVSMTKHVLVSPTLVDTTILNLGIRVDHKVFAVGHMAMVSAPRRVAEIIKNAIRGISNEN